MTAAAVVQPETDIAARVAQITSGDSPLMRQARTSGMQAANRRGVMNSTMGIGAAQSAALGVATPIASQESQERQQATLARAQISSNDRNAMIDAQVRASGDYNSVVGNIMANTKLTAAARNAALNSARGIYQQNLDSLRQAYTVNLPATAAPTAPPAGIVPGIGGGA